MLTTIDELFQLMVYILFGFGVFFFFLFEILENELINLILLIEITSSHNKRLTRAITDILLIQHTTMN